MDKWTRNIVDNLSVHECMLGGQSDDHKLIATAWVNFNRCDACLVCRERLLEALAEKTGPKGYVVYVFC